ncbi:DnaJ-like protein DjlA [hydrothermal vent metagenome]|uniref:DnaJ-like protein DjlA n=1 Tax=hydrothermal vent metagenome TaxID=652676 RepID=A0A3B0T0B6_9ZZZZ
MSIWGKLVGAAAGLTLGGPIGALVGAIAGHYALDRKSGARAGGGQRRRAGAQAERQVAFTIGVIALGAKMAKADGRVTRDEVAAFRQIFHVPPAEKENVARVFNLAKKDIAGYEAYAAQLAQLFGPQSEILEDVLDGLFHIAKADGVVHPSERTFLEQVARRFGFSGASFERICARHIKPDEGDPYVVLGLNREVDDRELKRTYRKLVRENHPDRMIARGVPEEFVAIATERLARINVAFDRIQAERGI